MQLHTGKKATFLYDYEIVWPFQNILCTILLSIFSALCKSRRREWDFCPRTPESYCIYKVDKTVSKFQNSVNVYEEYWHKSCSVLIQKSCLFFKYNSFRDGVLWQKVWHTALKMKSKIFMCIIFFLNCHFPENCTFDGFWYTTLTHCASSVIYN